jgi:hypothetical protein
MIVEYICYALSVDKVSQFQAAYELASGPLTESLRCLGHELVCCREDPTADTRRMRR